MRPIKSYIEPLSDRVQKLLSLMKKNRDAFVFALFFLLATGLWFLNALQKDFTTTISYPIRYTNIPDGFFIVGKVQNKLQLKVKSQGYDILPYYFGKIITPKSINVGLFKLKENSEQIAYLPTNSLLKTFADALPNGIELIGIHPDTLYTYLDTEHRKKVPVKLNAKFSFEKQYHQSSNIIITPDSIEISGAASLIDTITHVTTKFQNVALLNDSLVRNFELKNINEILFSPSIVKVTVPVEPFTQKSITLPITQLNVPDSLILKTFPSEINLKFIVAASMFNKIKPDHFIATVDFNQHTSENLPDKLKVKIQRKPSEIKNVSYSPLFVECLFEKKTSK